VPTCAVPCTRLGWKLRGAADNGVVSNDNEVAGNDRITIHWRRVLFSAGLFWFWYLTPSLAAYVVQAKALEPLVALFGR
jgi:hypothetical protein